MAFEMKPLVVQLEGIIERLEEARSEALIADLDLGSDSLDSETDDMFEGVDSALIDVEGRVEAVTQVMAEEIDNLRGLLESLEEGT